MKPYTEAFPFRVRDHVADKVPFVKTDAEAAERALLQRLDGFADPTLLPIDFTGVRVSSEAARQLLRRPLLRVTGGELTDRYLVLGDLGDSQYNVEVMLAAESLTAIERTFDDGPVLRGRVDPAVRATYELLLAVPTATANLVLEELNLTNISTATNRLSNLAKLGLARRVERRPVPGGGREFVYAAVR
jgi:hypothetical protein